MTPIVSVPLIPEDAPFTPEQRSWLNGLLAGLFQPPALAGVPVASIGVVLAVLYASQSGTAEGLARKIAKELKAKGHTVSLSSLEGYVPATLAAERYALFIVSTYGEGDAPDNAQPFYEQLCVEHFPRYENLSYAVLALGDKHYEHFCKFGKDLDGKLESLGARRILDLVDSDVEVAEPFARWKESVTQSLQTLTGSNVFAPALGEDSVSASQLEEAGSALPTGSFRASNASGGTRVVEAQIVASQAKAANVNPHKRENPFHAALVDKHDLTQDVSSKQTVHLAFSLEGAELVYEVGDALGVIGSNDPALVDEILAATQFTGEEEIAVDQAGALSLREALLKRFAITNLSRRLVQRYAAKGVCPRLQGLLAPEQQSHLDEYVHGRGLIDLLTECPGVIASPADLTGMLAKLSPRLYSISSSPRAHAGEVHTTVAVVRYRTHDRQRGGVCSTMLADRVEVGERVPVYIQVNKKFRLPQDKDAPIIMIGPGTGIAPFRAFLHDRRAQGAAGKNWLFFGERSAKTDFLYCDELQGMLRDGHLTRLDLAFSRDQQQKIYVQDRMLEQAAMLWEWLQEGASVYVCGDASRMAKDVDHTLHKIVEQQGSMDQEAAAEYVVTLKDEHRYHRDVY